jgi:hypothetical protein
MRILDLDSRMNLEGTFGQGIKLKGYYPYFGVQPFTFPSKYFATLQKGRGNFL